MISMINVTDKIKYVQMFMQLNYILAVGSKVPLHLGAHYYLELTHIYNALLCHEYRVPGLETGTFEGQCQYSLSMQTR